MNDKTFAQALEELNQRAIKEITDEALHCWLMLQQEGSSVATVTAYIENEHKKEAVTHVMFYVLFQSCLHEAKQHKLITSKRYDELRTYLNELMNATKQQPLMVLPIETK